MRTLVAAILLLCLPLFATAAAGNLVKEGDLRRVVSDYVMRRSAGLGAEVRVKQVGIFGDMQLPPGRVTYEAVAPYNWDGFGNTTLALVVRVDDEVKRNVTVPVEVEALVPMVVTTRTLERGEVIGKGDVTLEKRDLARVQGRFLRTPQEAIGMLVKNAMPANSPVRGDFIARVPVVKCGQLVTILLENDELRITATGRAQQSGAPGDLIPVQNVASSKVIPARVVDANTVRVDF